MLHITIPVSPGELVDKITVLEIKTEEITDGAKLKNVFTELSLLTSVLDADVTASEELSRLRAELKVINKKIWDTENDVREFWNDDAKCLLAARGSHHNNDERARVKREINTLLGSTIVEEKSHPTYDHKI